MSPDVKIDAFFHILAKMFPTIQLTIAQHIKPCLLIHHLFQKMIMPLGEHIALILLRLQVSPSI